MYRLAHLYGVVQNGGYYCTGSPVCMGLSRMEDMTVQGGEASRYGTAYISYNLDGRLTGTYSSHDFVLSSAR